MKNPLRLITRLLDAAHRRYRSARPGSVLIMVVSLLVLLALIGTAAMSTARIDRYSSRQNTNNVQVDLLAESLKNLVVGQLVDALFSGAGNRTTSHVVSPETTATEVYDAILGARTPTAAYVYDAGAGATAQYTPIAPPAMGSNPAPKIVWDGMSYPPVKTGDNGTYRVDFPDEPAYPNAARHELLFPKGRFQPWYKEVNGEVVPALKPLRTYANGTPTGAPAHITNPLGRVLGNGDSTPFTAADTDADGVADAFLFKLPMSPIGGVTYYGAVRVVDNAAALNVNTALNPLDEMAEVNTPSGTPIRISLAGIFPASVDLEALLDPNNRTEFQGLYNRLLTGEHLQAASFANPIEAYYSDDGAQSEPGVLNMVAFLTPGEAFWMQLGRRLNAPGVFSVAGGRRNHFGNGHRPFGIGDSMALASRFVLANPTARGASPIEQALFNSVSQNARTIPYTVPFANAGNNPSNNPVKEKKLEQWYQENFPNKHAIANAAQDLKATNARALLTALGPVRNTFPTTQTAKVNPNNTPDLSMLSEAFFDGMKSFTETVIDPAPVAPTDVEDPYKDSAFINLDDNGPRKAAQGATTARWQNWYPANSTPNPARMFKSPLRPPTVEARTMDLIPPAAVARLRAEIAAVNTYQLRKGLLNDADEVEVRSVALPGTPYVAKVYGVYRQPFITQVFLNNDSNKQVNPPPNSDPNAPPVGPNPNLDKRNPQGFAAVELHNPYDVPIDIAGWQIAVVTRAPGDSATLQNPYLTLDYLKSATAPQVDPTLPVDPNPPAGPGNYTFPTGSIIPPHGFMILWNYEAPAVIDPNDPNPPPPPPATLDPDLAQWLPGRLGENTNLSGTNPRVKVVTVKTLHAIMDKEMILMRPAKPAGSNTFAPVDSFDATGIPHNVATVLTPNAADAPFANLEEWHYCRAGAAGAGAADRSWHFVYPGRYDGGSTTARHQGTHVEKYLGGGLEPFGPGGSPQKPLFPKAFNEVVGSFGDLKTASSRDAEGTVLGAFPIQIANFDNRSHFVAANGAVAHPGQGFARLLDLMHVTFIGSYTIEPQTPGAPNTFFEINAVTMDSVMAEDSDDTTDKHADTGLPLEDIGHYAPIIAVKEVGGTQAPVDLAARTATGTLSTASGKSVDDPNRKEVAGTWTGYDIVIEYGGRKHWNVVETHSAGGQFTLFYPLPPGVQANDRYTLSRKRYQWCANVYENFSVLSSPEHDFLPNVDTDTQIRLNLPTPEATKNSPQGSIAANDAAEKLLAPTEGLININTAGWQVLSRLPMVMFLNTGVNPPRWEIDEIPNAELAKKIVYFRDVDDMLHPGDPVPHPHGPFRNIFELTLVPGFAEASGLPTNGPWPRGVAAVGTPARPAALNNAQVSVHDTTKVPGPDNGDFSPLEVGGTREEIAYDWKMKYLNLNRISNLITTRSDAFTVYLQVQGWRDAGGGNAKMVVQRRLAFIVDRSELTPTKRTPKVYNIPAAQ